jgi:hypothetical protein
MFKVGQRVYCVDKRYKRRLYACVLKSVPIGDDTEYLVETPRYDHSIIIGEEYTLIFADLEEAKRVVLDHWKKELAETESEYPGYVGYIGKLREAYKRDVEALWREAQNPYFNPKGRDADQGTSLYWKVSRSYGDLLQECRVDHETVWREAIYEKEKEIQRIEALTKEDFE